MKKFLDIFHRVIEFICICQTAIIVSALFYAVVMRYLFHQPPAWSMELSRFLFIWMIILSAALVTREQSHIQVTFFTDLMPEKIRVVWLNLLRLLMLLFCFVTIHQGLTIYPVVSEARSPTMNLSMGWLYIAIPAGGLLIGTFIVENVVRSICGLLTSDRAMEDRTC